MKDSDKGLRGSAELAEALADDLAEKLREANTGGVTKWLGLKERLDFKVLEDFVNLRKLLRDSLKEKLSKKPAEKEVAETRKKAQNLLEALDAFEENLLANTNVEKDNGNAA